MSAQRGDGKPVTRLRITFINRDLRLVEEGAKKAGTSVPTFIVVAALQRAKRMK